ncbi:MAG: DUF2851 family protein [Ferruginibacter sp.]
MTEKLLHFIWQHQYFETKQLHCTQGDALLILDKGTLNTNQGPDFLNGKIKIASTTLAGNIELHVLSSDWDLHQHSTDQNYQNIILHVVWKHDHMKIYPFPTVELQPLISSVLLSRYEELMQSVHFIPCQQHLASIPEIIFSSWKERLLVERLQDRAKHIEQLLKQCNNHWEEIFWWLLASNFGVKINSDSFERIAKTIPVKLLAKHKSQILQIEALLLGQAAILDKKFDDDYPNMLRREYIFLQKKYHLKKAHAPLYFLRMRPANFPTVRLAQLAMLIQQSHHLFSIIKEVKTIKELQTYLNVTANDYWHYRYMPDHPTAFRKKTLGKSMMDNICINTIIPVLYAYGYYHNIDAFKNKAIDWLRLLHAEQNKVVRGFERLGISSCNAFDSQALLQLKKWYCDEKKCLQCAVGLKLLKG